MPVNYGAKKGQQIAGRLYRGTGGKFTSGAGSSDAAPPPDQTAVPSAYYEDGSIDKKYLNALDQIFMGKPVTDKKLLESLRESGLLTDTNKLTAVARALVKAQRKGDREEVKRLSTLAAEKYKKQQAAKVPKPPKAPKAGKAGKAGKGTSPKPEKAGKPEKPMSPSQVVSQLTKAVSLDKSSLGRLSSLVSGSGEFSSKDVQSLVQHGLATGSEKVGFKATPLGKMVQQAIADGDYQKAYSLIIGYVRKNQQAGEMFREVMTKNMGGRVHTAGDFLVVEDPQKPSTWHLPVKVKGKPDHGLMGAAWAALHRGYRGNTYGGPMKDKARSALKQLYKREGMELPTEEAQFEDGEDLNIFTEGEEPETESVLEYDGDSPAIYRPYGGAKSFADLIAAQKANEAADMVRRYCYQFPELVMNIISDPMVENKPELIRKLAAEFTDLVERSLAGMNSDQSESDTPGLMELHEDLEMRGTGFEEVQELSEAASVSEQSGDSPKTVAFLEVEIIQPGWGNRKDNNFYHRDVLRRDAKVFVGSKMYETDHRESEKSNRTWVSTVTEITGFSPTGAPIGRVAIHDPDFAARVRNLHELKLLSKLECSILGKGQATPNYSEGERKGNRVERLVEITSVDWVTRAGAGGRAVALVETDRGGTDIMDGQTTPAAEGQTLDTPEPAKTVVPTQETAAQEVVIREGEKTAPPASLDKGKVQELLAASTLPKVSQDRLALAEYADEPAVQTAITAEIEYVKSLTGSGRPVGLGESETAPTGNPVDMKALGERLSAVNKTHLGPIISQ